MTGLWNLKDIQNSRQNRSKNKLVRKNVVTRAHGSFIIYLFILFFLFSITKYLVTILTYKQCMVLTLLTKLYSTYKTILIYNVRYLRY